MRTLAVLTTALLAVACKPAQQAEAPAPDTTNTSAMNYATEVAALPRQARDAVFFRAIRDAGLPCQTIVSSDPMPDAPPPSVIWRAQCEDKAYHLIQIQPNGSAVVTSRTTP
ncbi:putative lipoprotein [Sphingobium herbicidovorans NBRC 16415]|jgi:hypothetical protein|uniref:Lipoprotein n=1 Tax=Sphingobium herbicidovorans (strain ATCC 700291 / DSM 11019 / CCUG 56400 / KCTC 2939 / LMG 18315 / NBRC 16415 / MH) TaxID=1219045 RepID=A0A086P9F8_SPHHM|nr:hypothetical protein [Sphingobium herbicidovorans]KFG90026.1 putative lipoprotein [Sphingobium herbicidovorans NBRC 16415]